MSYLTCTDCDAGELVFNPQNVTEKNVICRRYPPVPVVAGYSPQGAQIVSIYPQIPANTPACAEFLGDEIVGETASIEN